MAKQANIQGAIDKLRTSNEKTLGEINDRSGEIAFNTRTTKNLIGDMLDGMALDRQRGQDEEESVSKKEGGTQTSSASEKDGGIALGIGGILAGIAGAALGFVSGFVSAFTRPLFLALKKFKVSLKQSGLGKFLTKFSKNIVKQVKLLFQPLISTFKNIRLAFANGLKGNTKVVRGAMGKMLNPVKGFVGFFGRIGNLLSPIVKDMKRRIKVVRKSLGILRSGITSTTGFFGRVGSVFSKISGGVKKAGSVMQGLGKAFKVAFKVFATIGRVIALPITIITGLFTGIKGMFADFTKSKEDGEGLLKNVTRGFFGFIKGAINGIIMMPLDLLKNGIGWIAGKPGFENFENLLAGFSFAGLFSGLVDGVVNGVFGFFDGYIQIWKDAFSGAIEGFKDGGIFGAISGFFGSIATSIKNVFVGLIEKVFGLFEGGDDMFAALGQGIANIKQSIKNFFIGLLPEQGSFMSKFVPDSVYEWAGQPAVSESEGSELPTEEPQQFQPELPTKEPQRGMFEEKVNEGGLAFKADMDKRNAEFEAEYAKQQAEMNAIRMDALKSGDTTKLEKKKEEQRMSWEDKQKAEIENLKARLESGETTFTWTDADIAEARSEGDLSAVEWMEYDNSEEGQEDQMEDMRKSLAIKEKNLAEFKTKQAQDKADIEKYGDLDTARLSKMDESRREKLLTRSRDLMMRHNKGEQVNLANKKTAEMTLAAEQRRQQAMIVAPSTQVVNNNSSQGIVMNQNMPALDPLDQAYGV